MVEVIRRGGEGESETVFVGIVDALPKLLASRLLVRAFDELPLLHVVVREGLPGELFPALAAHQLDIVIANEAAPLKTVLFSTKTGRHEVRFVASTELKKTYRPGSGLAGFPVLLPTRESPLRRELDRWFAEKRVIPMIRAEFDDAAAMWEMAAAGAGATPVIDPVLPDVAARYGLMALPLKTGIHEELYIVTAERQFSHAGQRAIARLAREVGGK
jgi:LysR family transcriptional activator of nhaA